MSAVNGPAPGRPARVNPAIARAAAAMRRAPTGTLRVTFSRPSASTDGTDAYDPATNTYAPGAPLAWAADALWVSVASLGETAAPGAEGAIRLVERRALLVAGGTLTPPDGAAPEAAPVVPRVGDVAVVDGLAYAIVDVLARGDAGGGLAPLYRCEVGS